MSRQRDQHLHRHNVKVYLMGTTRRIYFEHTHRSVPGDAHIHAIGSTTFPADYSRRQVINVRNEEK